MKMKTTLNISVLSSGKEVIKEVVSKAIDLESFSIEIDAHDHMGTKEIEIILEDSKALIIKELLLKLKSTDQIVGAMSDSISRDEFIPYYPKE